MEQCRCHDTEGCNSCQISDHPPRATPSREFSTQYISTLPSSLFGRLIDLRQIHHRINTMSTTPDQKHAAPQDEAKPLPTSTTTSEWETSLIQCFPCGLFWKAIACPCIFYDQTAQRLRDLNLPAEENNADCKDFAVNKIKKKYSIPGSETKDCLVSCFCCSCAVMQQNGELRGRQEKEGIRVGYKSQAGMVLPGGGERRREGWGEVVQ
ncbi:hypothetical protein QC761_504625 [Podospora bellae-mahoneyi]|uniref:Uncharacterized protein n=1 Tax=Podospora bellae-mahoneyi TaxID=2093777 RepID=A0ABR0FDX7_9PEZI|nr:hypothetical protein QC761_504625 [Podospora bellae-mahoneyi]